jgi:hypothetical protein
MTDLQRLGLALIGFMLAVGVGGVLLGLIGAWIRKAKTYRVGGVYGGYGNRAKVMSASPWPPTLAAALAAEFRAQGVCVDAIAADSSDAYRLGGDVRNFSTEARWGREAHIGVTVRLLSPDNRPLVEKRIDVKESGYNLNNFNADILEELLNRAFAKFVRDVATDAEIRGALR